jgi:hypothetical protein
VHVTKNLTLDDDQIYYLNTVLGIDAVVLPPLSQAQQNAKHEAPPIPALAHVEGVLATARLLVLLPLRPEEFPLRGAMHELVNKMIRAMKLQPSDVALLAWVFKPDVPMPSDILETLASAGSRPVLMFGLEEAQSLTREASAKGGAWFDLGGAARVLSTFAPRDLLDSTEKKRLAWAHLQLVMQEL